MLQLSRLRVLVEVHRRGSVTAAAEALNYTPSALSQQLSRLERECGARLLERVGRGVRLTPAAVRLVGHAQEVMTRLEIAEAELGAQEARAAGRMRVAAFHTVLLGLIPFALDWLEQRHPELEIEMVQREAVSATEALISHDFDLVLGEEFPGAPDPVRAGLHRVDIGEDPLLIALPLRPSSAVPEVQPGSLSDLAGARWALDPAGMSMGRWARSVCRAAGFEPRLRCEAMDPLLWLQLVRTGHAAALVPALLPPEELRGVGLYELPDRPSRTIYTLVREGGVNRPGVRALRAALAAAIEHLAPPTLLGRVEVTGS